MASLDVFRNDAFGVVSLTAAVNKMPFVPGRVGRLGLFAERGITTTTAVVEERSGELALIQSSPRGGPGKAVGKPKRAARSFVVPHLEENGFINADEVQNVRAFGSETEIETVQTLVNQLLQTLRQKHEATLEYHRVKALQGIILDADGSTLLNLFTAFGVSQNTYALDMSDDIRNGAVAIQRQIERAIGGQSITGYRALCGDDFFDALVASTAVKASLAAQESALMRADLRAGFEYGGIIWENYRGQLGADLADVDDETKDVDGDSVSPFIAADEAYVVPLGTDLFITRWAPADFIETVNTIGVPIYAKQAPDPEFNRWIKVHTQSNPLNLVTRPRAVCKVTQTT